MMSRGPGPAMGSRGNMLGRFRNPDMIGSIERLLALMQGQRASDEPPEFETPHWQDIENLKWLTELIASLGTARSAYMGDLFANGQAPQSPFGSILPGGAVNLPRLFITPPTPEPVQVPDIQNDPRHSRVFNRMRRNTGMSNFLRGVEMPMKTVYPWRPPVNPRSVAGFGQGGDPGDIRND